MKKLPTAKQMRSMTREQRQYWLGRVAQCYSPLRPHEVSRAAGLRKANLEARLPKHFHSLLAL